MPDVIVMVFSAPLPVAATPFPTKFSVVACVDRADPSSLTVTPDVNALPSWNRLPVKFILPPTSRLYWATVVPIPTLPDVKDILYAVVPKPTFQGLTRTTVLPTPLHPDPAQGITFRRMY